MDVGKMVLSIDLWAVFVAALSTFFVGWIWYGPLFGKKWMRLNGFTKDNLKEGGLSMPAIMGFSFLGSLIAAFAMAAVFGDGVTISYGICTGLVISVFWISTSRLNDVLYEKQPFALFLINAGYNVVSFVLMGIIISVWQ